VCITFSSFRHQVVAPTIENPACQEQLIEAAKHVAKNVDCVVENAQVKNDHIDTSRIDNIQS